MFSQPNYGNFAPLRRAARTLRQVKSTWHFAGFRCGLKLEDAYLRELLTRLDGTAGESPAVIEDAENIEQALAALQPNSAATTDDSDTSPTTAPGRRKTDAQRAEAALEQRLAVLRDRIAAMSGDGLSPAESPERAPSVQPVDEIIAPAVVLSAPKACPVGSMPNGEFFPLAPADLAELGIPQEEIEPLALKYLMNRGACSGRQIAEQLGVPFSLMEKVLLALKTGQSVVHKGAAPLGDHIYQLTSGGTEEARQALKQCSYFGAVPVPLDAYITSVERQSIRNIRPSIGEIGCVFHDLLVAEAIQHQVGQAVHSGKGFFLHGAPGNGKTSIAERVARAFGQYVWIPRALGIAGEIVRLYDPCNHVEAPLDPVAGALPGPLDRRWVRIKRPTVIAGGELTLDRLDISVNRSTGINEAPLQLKSNCGVLVIDDFGRQRVSVVELLNRWIVPLDRRYDFLQLPSGKTVQVPFDQLLVFSTNLEPRDLVDEAFLRRIAYKIEVSDPSLDDFRVLLAQQAERIGCAFDAVAIDHLIEKHYVTTRRAIRACHARDLLDQVQSYCGFRKLPLAMSPEAFDAAARNYFGLMQGTEG
jgi:hypothetical protein